MKNNILAPLVVFFITLTGLLIIDDMAHQVATTKSDQIESEVNTTESQSDLIKTNRID